MISLRPLSALSRDRSHPRRARDRDSARTHAPSVFATLERKTKRNHRGRSISLDRSLVRSGIKRAHAVVVVAFFVAASRRFVSVPVGLCRREKRAK